ncbi:hypothetical protein KL942_001627 [Ogataea angusta]|uniref:Flavodoxin-like domain-containing protein n=1 Tax=Pichia angusta TaxID=870730 RepID=A0AAN6I5J1_PICAN|nr:uncharacterized protein KL928_002581 [Ogataea angusta]KAG7818713.1 hypothetical protein KL928_002581 [Ogataea angusta]KAG7824959.1 hypothetical protein KL909_001251 [Ogataea angusta]KAG7830146.1 hypothetical protein KL920_001784 [Ogataea angusta]KAG7834722.1 hypothetical protein KL943_003106 [Ogataea angusta]KAG7841748.1 hypothetical protein KL942_001627 [Ogataea angusta]
MAKFAIITYSTYGHITTLAKEVAKGIEAAGAEAEVFRVPETLSKDVLEIIHAPEKPDDIPEIKAEDLTKYDGFVFGFPTRYGAAPSQITSLFDSTGALWATGALYHKPAGFFTSTGTGGGKETTIRNTLSFLSHHGMIYVPLGYAKVFPEITSVEEVQGSSPWGAGTIAGSDASREPTALELKTAYIQGQEFAAVATKLAAPLETAATEVAAAAGETSESAPAEEKKATAAESEDVKKPETSASAAKSSEKSGCCVIV